jgi:chitosanase
MIFMSFSRRTLGLAVALVACCWGVASASVGLSSGQRVRVDKLISQFENSTSKIQYCYVAALGDGRGYTVGRAGFTSATGDLLEVARLYTKRVPGNPLADLLPRLRELAREGSGSLEGLEALPDAWRSTCRDPRQRATQDAVVDKEYYRPAVRHAIRLKLHLPLSLAAIYDASIQHGDGPDPDGVPAMLRRAARRAGGTPASGVGEKRFVRAFLYVRRATLAHAHDPSTRRAWAASVGRVDAWKYLVRTGQWRLRSPIKVRTRLYHLTIADPAPAPHPAQNTYRLHV